MTAAPKLGEYGYERRENEDYFTAPWITEVLCKALSIRNMNIWEPACGSGKMASVLTQYNNNVFASDIRSYGYLFQNAELDFLHSPHPNFLEPLHGIVTNPPYLDNLIEQFIRLAVGVMRPKGNPLGKIYGGGFVAMLLRHEFDAPISHWELFKHPYYMKIILPRRPKWIDPEPGKKDTGARIPYAWYIWNWDEATIEQDPITIWVNDDGSILSRG